MITKQLGEASALSNLGNLIKDKRIFWRDMDKGTRFATVSNYFFCCLSFLTAMVLVRLMHLVYKKLGSKDLVISFMLFFLTLACLASTVFFGESIFYSSFEESDAQYHKKQLMWPGTLSHIEGSNLCLYYATIYLPSLFLFCAVVLNINKWIYFKWRIIFLSNQIIIVQAVTMDQDAGKQLSKEKEIMAGKVRRLNIASVAVILVYLVFNISYVFYEAYGTFNDMADWSDSTA